MRGLFFPGEELLLTSTEEEPEMDDYEQGLETLRKMLGEDRAATVVEKFRRLSPVFEREAVTVVFGRTWSRSGIDRKTRSFCSIGILAALGRMDALKINFALAIAHGAGIEEIEEVLLQVGIYAGYPAALDALKLLAEVRDATFQESEPKPL
jgi:alkylhydroperoxidase/carboxymuconolactone decarboxylase family protein YurZ